MNRSCTYTLQEALVINTLLVLNVKVRLTNYVAFKYYLQ